MSTAFPLHSRQSCLLCTGLFVVAIEPLTEAIRQNPIIKGVEVDQTTHKINQLADDIINL